MALALKEKSEWEGAKKKELDGIVKQARLEYVKKAGGQFNTISAPLTTKDPSSLKPSGKQTIGPKKKTAGDDKGGKGGGLVKPSNKGGSNSMTSLPKKK